MESSLETFRTSFLLCIMISTTLASATAHSNQLSPSGKIKQNTKLVSSNRHLLDRRRREARPQEHVNQDEDFAIGSVIFSVSGSDSAERFSHGEPVNPRFSVDERTGDIVLLEALDFETSPQEIVNVEITSNINHGKKFLFC